MKDVTSNPFPTYIRRNPRQTRLGWHYLSWICSNKKITDSDGYKNMYRENKTQNDWSRFIEDTMIHNLYYKNTTKRYIYKIGNELFQQLTMNPNKMSKVTTNKHWNTICYKANEQFIRKKIA